MSEADPERPLVVPVFLPHAGCPHRCVFCNQSVISGASPHAVSDGEVHRRIGSFLAAARPRNRVQIAFYGGNFLGLPPGEIRRFLSLAGAYILSGTAGGIRFSTRPDTIDEEKLSLLRSFPVQTVEIGAQSMDERVLALCRRGHTVADTQKALALLKASGYEAGLQLMVGLPGEDESGALQTAREAAALRPDFVRLYPTLVLKDSLLANWYLQKRYHPLCLDEAVQRTAREYLIFSGAGIRVARMGIQPSIDLRPGIEILAGPHHPAFGERVLSEVFRQRLLHFLEMSAPLQGPVRLLVHPRRESQLRGHKNQTLQWLEKRFPEIALEVKTDALLDPNALVVECGEKRWET